MPPEQKKAVMAHGFADSYDAPWWNTAERKLRERGYDVTGAEFDDAFRTARASNYSDYLEEELEELKADEDPDHLIVVAHDMGGPVARHLTESEGYTEHDALITFQSFHQGTRAAEPLKYVFESIESISPESEFIQELNNDGVSDEIEYINVYTPNDPLLPKTERARLPEAENVENIEIGATPCEAANQKFKDSINIWTEIGKDAMRDITEATGTLFDSFTDPAALFKKENRPRIANPKMVGLRAGQLYHAHKVEDDQLANSLHTTLLKNEEAWDRIDSHLS